MRELADLFLSHCYPERIEHSWILDHLDQTFETLFGCNVEQCILLPVIFWMLSREPARVLIFCEGEENRDNLTQNLKRRIEESLLKLPFNCEQESVFRKTLTDGSLSPLSYILVRCASIKGLFGNFIARTNDGIPKTLAVYYQVPIEDVKKYREMTDTWAQRTIVVNAEYKPFDFNSLFE